MATILEVAQKAGVSATTVSHVVNNTRFVSTAVRERVHNAMDELGYRPNDLARSLRRGETNTLGLILPDSANPFFAEIACIIEAEAFHYGYSVILCNSEGDLEKESVYADVLAKKQVDAMIFVASGEQSAVLPELCRKGLPLVLVDRAPEAVSADIVLADNLQGGMLAARHLIDLGHSNIGCITGPNNLTPSANRVTGFRKVLEESGIVLDETNVLRGSFHPISGYQAAMGLLSKENPPTAIFACNDMMAIGVLRAASELGLDVPRDLSLIGFDNIELSVFTTPALTTISQPKTAIGVETIRLVIERIADKDLPPRRLVLPTQLISRNSTMERDEK